MLGRSANGIFWMSRYLERAENTAFLLDVGFRLALTRGQSVARDEWRSVMVTAGLDDQFRQYHDQYTGPAVTNFILRDKNNPASVLAMVESARSNARAVRTVLTREVWEATNETWLVLCDQLSRPVTAGNLGDVLASIRRQTTLVRGAMDGTMLRNDIFNFARIGTAIERADNTARILDVKYHVLLPAVSWVGSTLDHAQWENILRSVAGERAYRWLNAGNLDSTGIAEFLILDRRFPRSIAFCYKMLENNMDSLAHTYGEETASHALMRDVGERLNWVTIEQIFEFGLHEFIVAVIAEIQKIADAVASDYRFTG
jgi:uncharacterized alpha-E superfamily protein